MEYNQEELIMMIRRFKNHAEIHGYPSVSFKKKVKKILGNKNK